MKLIQFINIDFDSFTKVQFERKKDVTNFILGIGIILRDKRLIRENN